MKFAVCLFAALVIAVVTPASACLPPPPGTTEAERLKPSFDAADHIVYGVVTKGAKGSRVAEFRVIHAYKGDLKPGATVRGQATHGFDPPPCLGDWAFQKPSIARGQYGVIAFSRQRPALNFVNFYTLDTMFKEGWIKKALR